MTQQDENNQIQNPEANDLNMPPQQPVESSQPEYGQYKRPEYGAMDSEFPRDYNPYLYGRDTPASLDEVARQVEQSRHPQSANNPNATHSPSQQPMAYPFGMSPQEQQLHEEHMRQQQGYVPHIIHGVDVNDPQQNPFYGKWDLTSICAFVFALFFPASFFTVAIPIIMGAMGIWRTKTFHMKGFGLAVAAIVISVLALLILIWMKMKGIDTQDLMNQMMQMMGTSGNGGDSVSA